MDPQQVSVQSPFWISYRDPAWSCVTCSLAEVLGLKAFWGFQFLFKAFVKGSYFWVEALLGKNYMKIHPTLPIFPICSTVSEIDWKGSCKREYGVCLLRALESLRALKQKIKKLPFNKPCKSAFRTPLNSLNRKPLLMEKIGLLHRVAGSKELPGLPILLFLRPFLRDSYPVWRPF